MSDSHFTRGYGLLERYLAKKRTSLAKKLIPRQYLNGNVLDIGCGTYPFFLSKSGFAGRYGIDYSTDNKFTDKTIIIKRVNVEAGPLPFKGEFFNAVVMLAVFEHINKNKLKYVLREAYRVLEKNGIFIITTPSPWSDPLLHFIARFGLISPEEIRDHKHNLSHDNILKILTECGFTREKISKGFFELGFNMWICAKK